MIGHIGVYRRYSVLSATALSAAAVAAARQADSLAELAAGEDVPGGRGRDDCGARSDRQDRERLLHRLNGLFTVTAQAAAQPAQAPRPTRSRDSGQGARDRRHEASGAGGGGGRWRGGRAHASPEPERPRWAQAPESGCRPPAAPGPRRGPRRGARRWPEPHGGRRGAPRPGRQQPELERGGASPRSPRARGRLSGVGWAVPETVQWGAEERLEPGDMITPSLP
jgi:hypothetical protein